MEKELFKDLLESVDEAAAIERGDAEAAKVYAYEVPEVKEIRKKLRLTQVSFAEVINISIGTLRNWEQKRRTPTGPAVALLKVIEKYPDEVLSVSNNDNESNIEETKFSHA